MRIILPRKIVLITLAPLLLFTFSLISIVMFREFSVTFITCCSVIIYILSVYSFSIIIRNGRLSAKDRVFQIRRKSIRLDDIKHIKVEKVRSGESYIHLIGDEDKVILFKTYYSKKQETLLRKIIKESKNLNC